MDSPFGLLAELTYRCPLACAYCSNPLNMADYSDELGTDEWRRVLGEARDQAAQQARTGQHKAEESIRELARELREMADGGDHHGTASEFAVQAADRLHGVADWIGAREPGDLVEEVRRFARRRPGTFLLGAAVTGALVGRLTRGAVDAQRDTGSDANPYPARPTPDATTDPFLAAPPSSVPPVMPPATPPPHTYEPVPQAVRPPDRPTGTLPPEPGVPNGGAFPPPAPPAAPPAVPPVAPPDPGPQHSPRPGSMTVGEYIEQPERGGTIEILLRGNEGHRMLDNVTIDRLGRWTKLCDQALAHTLRRLNPMPTIAQNAVQQLGHQHAALRAPGIQHRY